MATLAPAAARGRRSSAAQRAGAALMALVSWITPRLPEWPLHRLAEAVGVAWYLGAPRRRGQARRNLHRIVAALAADGRGSPRVLAAARSAASLEVLLLAAFRHLARYYLEVARGAAYAGGRVAQRIEDRSQGIWPGFLETGRGTGERPGHGVIFVGLHLGALEFPSYLLFEAGVRVTAPMETIANRPLQAWFERTRSRDGLRLIPQHGAHPELVAALERGEAVGLVSDRVVRGRGAPAKLFGHPVRLPMAAALLALDHDVPVYAAAVWRTGGDGYAGRMLRLAPPRVGDRAERVRAFLAEEASAFESLIAEAPEQWWALFFPIWPDLEDGAP
jgi:KDO2-lipid IV(A) lauroyltransferase